MPFADNAGVGINYEVVGDGPPLLLHHGFTRSLRDWHDFGYVAALAGDFRLILMDSRGHGASDKPHDPAEYALELRVGDVCAVLDELDLVRVNYLGYSMGGRVGFALAKFAPQRLGSLAIGAATPLDTGFEPFAGIDGSDGEAFIAALEAVVGEKMPPELRAAMLQNDIRALTAVMQAPMPDLSAVLDDIAVPALFYVGEDDARYEPLRQCAQRAGAEFASLPGLNHGQGFMQSEPVLAAIEGFLRTATLRPAT
jgi:pimeloyl-ACP methyl ester carboxylesterase